jgi:hypothetical protein
MARKESDIIQPSRHHPSRRMTYKTSSITRPSLVHHSSSTRPALVQHSRSALVQHSPRTRRELAQNSSRTRRSGAVRRVRTAQGLDFAATLEGALLLRLLLLLRGPWSEGPFLRSPPPYLPRSRPCAQSLPRQVCTSFLNHA